MRPVDDLEDLGPVVGKVPGHPEHPELHARSKPSARARGGPPEPDRHEFHDGPFPSDTTSEVHLNRRCHERDFFFQADDGIRAPEVHGLDPLAAPSQKIWGYETTWGSFAQFCKVQAQ